MAQPSKQLNIFDRLAWWLLNRRGSFHVSQQPPGWIVKGYGTESYSGEDVNAETALTVSAVWGCITILAETVASLPLILYRRTADGKERATKHPLYGKLHDSPNPEHTSFIWRELSQGHLGAWGNAYSQIIRSGGGDVLELWPLRPDRMSVERVGGKKVYTYTRQDSSKLTFGTDEILHVQAFGTDGLVGYSPITQARNAIGVTISAEKYGGKVFANDARPSVALKHPGVLGGSIDKRREAANRLRDEWNQMYQGTENAARVAVLEEGMDVAEIGFPPEDAQYMESRMFQVKEVARWYHMPLNLLGENDKSATYASMEQFMLSFVTHTIRPWLVRWEQSLNMQLLTEAEREEYFFEHLVDSLLRGDTAARYKAYAIGRQNGWLSANDIRRMENMNPIDGGDIYLVPLNMKPADQLEDEPSADEEPGGVVDTARASTKGTKDSKGKGLDLYPLCMDAAMRIVRREVQDVRDASKRWLEKGHEEKFDKWLTAFYETDHPEYVIRTLEPLMVVAGYTGEAQKERMAAILRTMDRAAMDDYETWMENHPAILARSILEVLNG